MPATAANGGGGRVDAPLREPQQRQARLRLEPELARAPVRLLGRRELALQPMDLGLLVERRGRSSPVDALRTRAGAPRFLDRLRPVAVQLHDLRAMHLADAGEGDHVGLALAPPRQGGRPLAGAVERVDRWQASITLQYIRPVTSGDSSPAVTATMISSRSASPSSTCPCCSRIRPCWWRAQATRSASPQRSPIAAASAAAA